MKFTDLTIPKDQDGPETEAEMHAEETRRAVEQSQHRNPFPSQEQEPSRVRRAEAAEARR